MKRPAAVVCALVAFVALGCTPSGVAPGAPPGSGSGSGGRAPAPSACPAPKTTTDMCVALMTYVKVGAECCAYGDPCSAPAGKTYDDDKCTRAR